MNDVSAWAGLVSPVGCVIFLFIALSKGWLWSGRSVDVLTKQWEDRLNESHNREQTLQRSAQNAVESARDSQDQARAAASISEAFVQALGAPRIAEKP
jgi:F0F1-type ATP synthase epsilon subunit